MQHVRFHGLLSDSMGTFLIHKDKPLYSFHNIDASYDALLEMGVRPVVELSFMPSALASGKQTVMHYADNVTPPKDWGRWESLIEKLVRHWVGRYGIDEVARWPIEVWNEPNLKSFYTGKFDDYITLYEHTSRIIKNIDSRLVVGGPVTAKNEWLNQFVEQCEKRDLPLDFLSTHIYPTDALGAEGDDTRSQLAHSERDMLIEKAQAAFEAAKGRPVWYTEWSSSSNPRDPLHDESFAAAYAVKAILDNARLVEAYSWWTFSDIFEENYFPSQVFQGGFGLLTIYNTPKPAYAAYRLMNGLGDEQLIVDGGHKTVCCWATRGERKIAVMLVNLALPEHDIQAETVRLQLKHVPQPGGVYVQRVDDEHCNPKRLWQEMGSPRYLDESQVALLEDAGRPSAGPIEYQYDADSQNVDATLTLPPQGLALLTIITSISDESGNETSVENLPNATAPAPGIPEDGDE